MRFTIWSCKGKYSIWCVGFLLPFAVALLKLHERESRTHQRGSCPRQINTRRTTERLHFPSIREGGAFSIARSSATSFLWRVLRDLRLRHGTSSALGKSAQTRRRRAGAKPAKKVAWSTVQTGNAQRRRERCASYSSKSQRRLEQRVLLPVRYISKISEGKRTEQPR
jgi:hypothetical protein